MRVLLTGAGGFIGGAVADVLSAAGHDVRGIDAFIPQAHGGAGSTSSMHDVVDVRDIDDVRRAARGADIVCHQAAMVGAGVTPADLPLYAGHNDLGTAVVLAAMAAEGVTRLVLASSMVVYGDGRYRCAEHGQQQPPARRVAALEAGQFDVACPVCGADLAWQPVPEDAPLRPTGSYAASKTAQEHYALAWARQLPGAVIALRYHNVYGPGMPRDTPYSGVAASFRSALERGEAPRVFEDGEQMRDFVHVGDVASANLRAVERVARAEPDTFEPFNVCSGRPVRIGRVAELVAAGAPTPLEPVVTGQFRPGDVRHIVASPDRARDVLGFEAVVTPDDGLRAFATVPLREA